MANAKCGWCKTLTYMKAVTGFTLPDSQNRQRIQAAYQCINCKGLSIASEYNPDAYGYLQRHPDYTAENYTWKYPVQWTPQPEGPREYPDLPDHIASAAAEAAQCLTGGTYRAVGGLARGVIEATGKEQGFTVNGIARKIDAMAEKGLLRPLVAEQPHEVRHFGNDMAHGDFATPTTREEAEEIIALMDEVLREVYQAPAQLARVKAARENRKADSKVESNE